MDKNLNKNVGGMFYETSRKDIFESSGAVNLNNTDSSPKHIEINDLTSTDTMTIGLN